MIQKISEEQSMTKYQNSYYAEDMTTFSYL